MKWKHKQTAANGWKFSGRAEMRRVVNPERQQIKANMPKKGQCEVSKREKRKREKIRECSSKMYMSIQILLNGPI